MTAVYGYVCISIDLTGCNAVYRLRFSCFFMLINIVWIIGIRYP